LRRHHARSAPAAGRRAAELILHSTLLLVLTASVAAAKAPPRFEGDAEEFSEAGYVTLRWTVPEDAVADEDVVRYQVALEAAPARIPAETIYEGTANASFLSGLVDGEYRFRVRARDGDAADWSSWSPPKVVVVRHHSKALALRLCALGGALFLVTAGFVMRHAFDRAPRSEEERV
jgi:hypothetical protein